MKKGLVQEKTIHLTLLIKKELPYLQEELNKMVHGFMMFGCWISQDGAGRKSVLCLAFNSQLGTISFIVDR